MCQSIFFPLFVYLPVECLRQGEGVADGETGQATGHAAAVQDSKQRGAQHHEVAEVLQPHAQPLVIGRTLIFQVRRSAELQGSMYGRTVPNCTVQSSAN